MTEDLPTGPSQPTDYDKVRAKEDAARVERNRQAAELLTLLEPKSYGTAAVSQAISIKRIADALETIAARTAPLEIRLEQKDGFTAMGVVWYPPIPGAR